MRAVATLVADRLQSARRAGLLLLATVAMLATASMVAGLSVLTTAGDRLDTIHTEQGRPDVVVYTDTAEEFRSILDSEDRVAAVGKPSRAIAADVGVAGSQGVNSMIIEAADPESVGVGAPRLLEGRWARGPDEIVIDRSWAVDSGVGLGDRVEVEIDGAVTGLAVVGTAIDLGDCSYPNCDPLRHFVDTAAFGRLNPTGDGFTRGFVSLEPGVVDEDFASSLLSRHPGISVQSWSDTRADLLIVAQVSSYFVTGMGVFVLLASSVVVAGAAIAAVVARRREIGLMKAMGAIPLQMAAAIVVEHVVVAVPGVLVGWLLGSWLAPSLEVGLVEVLGRSSVDLQPALLMSAGGAVLVVLAVATAWPAGRAARLSTVSALRDAPTTHGGRIQRLLDRMPGSPTLHLGTRFALARPLRTILAGLALILATVAVYATWSTIGAANTIFGDTAYSGDPWDIAIGPGRDAELVEAALRSEPAVTGWFRDRAVPVVLADQKVTTRATSAGSVEPGYVIIEGRAPARPGEAVVGWGFIDAFGYGLGDRVPFEARGTPMTVEIVGRYAETEDTGRVLLTPIETFEAAGVEVGIPSWRVSVDSGSDRAEVAARLAGALPEGTDIFAIESAEGRADPVIFPLLALAAITVVVALGNLAATMASTAGERLRQAGVLRALGVSTRGLLAEAAVAGAVVGGAAAVVGLPLGFAASGLLLDSVMGLIGIGPGLFGPPVAGPVLVLFTVGVALGAVVGVVAALPMVRKPTSILLRAE